MIQYIAQATYPEWFKFWLKPNDEDFLFPNDIVCVWKVRRKFDTATSLFKPLV